MKSFNSRASKRKKLKFSLIPTYDSVKVRGIPHLVSELHRFKQTANHQISTLT